MALKRNALALVLFVAVTACNAQVASIDTNASKVTIRVNKSGLFSAFAHNHVISAPIASGKIDRNGKTVELVFHPKDMKVLDPEASEKDRIQIDRDMKSEKVLDVERYPEIRFVSRNVTSTDATHFLVHGDLTLHAVTKPVELPVTLTGQRYTSEIKLKQTEFGITPIKVAGGTVKVKDEIEIAFEIVPAS
jgi:polyisoprenoid-binding protein YceI